MGIFWGEEICLFPAHPPPSKGTWPWARKAARGIGHPRAFLNPLPSLLLAEQEKTKQKGKHTGWGQPLSETSSALAVWVTQGAAEK